MLLYGENIESEEVNMKCKKCGREVEVTYDGLCSICLSIEASEEGEYLSDELDVSDLQINTPLSFKELANIARQMK